MNYDQIGLASNYCSTTTIATSCQGYDDVWTVIYSEGVINAPGCELGYTFSANAFPLAAYSAYTFEMSLSGTKLVFDVYEGYGLGGSKVWTGTLNDTASSFTIAGTEDCDNVLVYGLTNTEEVYDISNAMKAPQWNSGFAYTTEGSTEITTSSFKTYSLGPPPTSPHGYYIDYPNANLIRVDNVVTWIGYPTDTASALPGTQAFDNQGSLNADGVYCTNNYCTSSETCTGFTSGGSTGMYGPTSSVPQSSEGWYEDSGASQGNGIYYLGCNVTVTVTTPHEYTTFIEYVTIT